MINQEYIGAHIFVSRRVGLLFDRIYSNEDDDNK